MANDIKIEPADTGTALQVATDEIGGRHYQVLKLAVGGEGVAIPVDAAHPVPVSDGKAQGLTDAQLRASAVGVAVSNFPSTQAVSIASQPLPTGASSETTLEALRVLSVSINSAAALIKTAVESINAKTTACNTGSIAGTVAVSNLPSTQAVSGTVTANTGLSQPVTDSQMRATPIPVSMSGGASEATAGLTLVELQEINDKTPAIGDVFRDGEQEGLKETYTLDTNLMNVLGSQSLVENGGINVNTINRRGKQYSANLNALNAAAMIDCTGWSTIGIQISGVWSGTLAFFGSLDGWTWSYTVVTFASGNYARSSVTTNDLYMLNCAGIKYVRVIFSPYTSGNALLVFNLDSSPLGAPSEQKTYDGYLGTSISGLRLYTTGPNEGLETPLNPIANPSRPSYKEPKFAKTPNIFRRLRVESAGDQSVPFAQEPYTNKMLVSNPELLSMIEQLLIQQQITNQLLAQAYTLTLPSGATVIK